MASHSKKPPFFAVVEFKAEKSMAVVYSEWLIKGPEVKGHYVRSMVIYVNMARKLH